MNPIIERLSDAPKVWLQRGNEIVNPFIERLNDRSRELRERGEGFLADLHERQEKLFDRGQRALIHFEETVLERASELLEWAHGVTGERSEALLRSRDFLADRLAELRTREEIEEPVEEPAVEPETSGAEPSELEPPFEGYDKLNVKKLAAKFTELGEDVLRAARTYEEAKKGRKTVLEAIDKLLD